MIDEYLAMGKPVVATGTEGMELFRGFVSLQEIKNDWIIAIEHELKNNCEAEIFKKKEIAGQHRG